VGGGGGGRRTRGVTPWEERGGEGVGGRVGEWGGGGRERGGGGGSGEVV